MNALTDDVAVGNRTQTHKGRPNGSIPCRCKFRKYMYKYEFQVVLCYF